MRLKGRVRAMGECAKEKEAMTDDRDQSLSERCIGNSSGWPNLMVPRERFIRRLMLMGEGGVIVISSKLRNMGPQY